MAINWLLIIASIGSQLTHNRLNRFMLKARIARKKRALRAIRGQKARKACNFDGGLSEVADNKKSKLPKNDRYFRKMAEKRPKQPERYKKPVDRNGASRAICSQYGQLLVNSNINDQMLVVGKYGEHDKGL